MTSMRAGTPPVTLQPQQDDGTLTIKVVLPERNLRTALRVTGAQKAGDIVSTLAAKLTLQPAEDYALYSKDGVTRIEPARTVASLGLTNMSEVVMKKFQLRVTVLMPDVLPDDLCVDMIEPPDIRVDQLLVHVVQLATRKNAALNYANHGLYVPTARRPEGADPRGDAILMDGARPLASYRLRPDEQLIFRDRAFDALPKLERLGKHLQRAAPGTLFVVIESPIHGSSKIYGFAPTTTVGEIAHTFTETNPVSDIQAYGLFIKASGARVETLQRLGSLGLRTLDTLVFKRLDDADVAKLKAEAENEVLPTDVFGTEASGLPLATDYGLQVPAVLATLRQEITRYGGLGMEGIFRLGGEERKMVALRRELNRGTFVPGSTLEHDVFGVAALIKRWYGELPVRIFEGFPLKRLDRALESPQASVALLEDLPEPQRSLLKWMLYLLVDTATRRAVNLMDCNNLAIVVAPVLTTIPLSNPMEGLVMTQRVTLLLRQALEYFLAKAEAGALDALRPRQEPASPLPSSAPRTAPVPIPAAGPAEPPADGSPSRPRADSPRGLAWRRGLSQSPDAHASGRSSLGADQASTPSAGGSRPASPRSSPAAALSGSAPAPAPAPAPAVLHSSPQMPIPLAAATGEPPAEAAPSVQPTAAAAVVADPPVEAPHAPPPPACEPAEPVRGDHLASSSAADPSAAPDPAAPVAELEAEAILTEAAVSPEEADRGEALPPPHLPPVPGLPPDQHDPQRPEPAPSLPYQATELGPADPTTTEALPLAEPPRSPADSPRGRPVLLKPAPGPRSPRKKFPTSPAPRLSGASTPELSSSPSPSPSSSFASSTLLAVDPASSLDPSGTPTVPAPREQS